MKFILLVFLTILASSVRSQVNIVITAFDNETSVLFYDGWESAIPQLLKASFSAESDITIIDRERTEDILQEQALNLAGLMDDEQYEEIGRLLGAQFILSGKITQSNNQIYISADLIRIKTAETITEVVRSDDEEYFNDMVEILANNLYNRLTGKKNYINRKEYKSSAVWYWLGSFAITASAGLIFDNSYNKNLKKYRNATQLKSFDNYFDKANTALNLRNFLLGTGIFTLSGTLYHLIAGSNKNTISSGSQNLSLIPDLKIYEKKITFSLSVNF